MDKKPEAFGTFIERLLDAAGSNLAEVSHGCGISYEHLAMLIAGECMLTGDVALALAEYFDLPAVMFLDVQRTYLIGIREQRGEAVVPA